MAYASLEIIDGQHRLYGFARPGDDSVRQAFNLVVLGMSDMTQERRRDTFIAINDKAKRVDPNLVAYLKYTDDEEACQADNELMAIRIAVDLGRTGVLKNRIRLLDFGEGETITLKGFCGYDLKGLIGTRGLLRKHYQHCSAQYVKVLDMYFSVLKSLFRKQWRAPGKYVIFQNRGVSAFLKLLRSILKTVDGPVDAKALKKYPRPLTEWTDSHWETAKLNRSYVGSQGWKDFHRDLLEKIRRKHRHFQE